MKEQTIQHSDRGHSLFSPSSAHRWTKCPGSPHFISHLRAKGLIESDAPSERAEFGTAMHELAEYAFEKNVSIEVATEWACEKHPDYANEIQQSCQPYDSYVKRLRQLRGAGYEVRIEHQMHTEKTNPFQVGGTSDAVCYSEVKNHLLIFDIKTGRIPVRAIENVQLQIYAALALGEVVTGNKNHARVTLGIFQPTEYPFWSEWETTGAAVKKAWKDAALAANTPFSKDALVYGETQCKWCPAKGQCPAYLNNALEKAEGALSDLGVSAGDKKAVVSDAISAMLLYNDPAHVAKLFGELKVASDAFDLFKKDLGANLNKNPEGPLSEKFEVKVAQRTYVRWKQKPDLANEVIEAFGHDAVQPIPPKDFVKKITEIHGKDEAENAQKFVDRLTEDKAVDAVTIKLRVEK